MTTEALDTRLTWLTCSTCVPPRIWSADVSAVCRGCGEPGHPVEPAGPHPVPDPQPGPSLRFKTGGSFILDTPPDPTPLWGRGQSVLWAEGEALTIVGGQGVGKTTLAQQLALGRCGLPEFADVLGYPVNCGGGTWNRVLYLAMDRPRQAARSFRRMVGESMREELDRALFVWEGPPLVDIAKNPQVLLAYAEQADAETVVVDSIKDAALKLSDDEVGGGWNRARQIALRAGVELIELHHNRKSISGSKSEHPSIDDVYGSTWITSGAGSVLLLAGQPGDPVVKMHHLKQPAEEVGPLQVVHDHDTGRSSVWEQVDLLVLASATPGGITAAQAAQAMFDVEKETPAQRQKARRKLERLAREGLLTVLDEGSEASARATRWGVR